MKQAVFTFIFGDYDDLKTPTVANPTWDHFCFTDAPDKIKSPWIGLHSIPELAHLTDNKRKAVGHMILGHQFLAKRGYGTTLSVGAQIQIACSLNQFMIRFREDTRLLLMRHPERSCVYAEADACVALKKDDEKTIRAQMSRYHAQDFPQSWGLFATGVMGVRHSDAPDNEALHWWNHFADAWWHEVQQGSCRDQLSLTYCLRGLATPESISEIGWYETFHSKGFLISQHKK